MPRSGPTVRLVCVNDVYTLENFPRLRTLVQHAKETDPADAFLATMAGDFVSPSVLSSLDMGRGMVDCMNAIPITHAILGNHEDDIGVKELRARISELRATLISTNVLDLDPSLPKVQILEVGGAGRHVRVGLVGVVMDDPAVYRGAPFAGAKVLPPNDAAEAAARHLIAAEGCAAVIALTHQTAEADHALARRAAELGIAIIVGGHEHTVCLEQVEGTWIVKAGADAVHAVIVDIQFAAAPPLDAVHAPERPEVRVRLDDTANYAEDPALRARVDGHMRAVTALETAVLCTIPEGRTLSSVGARSRPTSLGRLLASLLRDALGAEACVMNGGGIRGSRTYAKHFTYGDLQNEVPFDNEVVVAPVPGAVLKAAIRASRARAPREWGGFLHVDDHAEVETVAGDGELLTRMADAPLDEARDYRVAIVRNLFEGMDHIEPLVRFAKERPSAIPPMGSGRDIKLLLVEAFSRALWTQFGTFDAVDENHDGFVDAQEIADAVTRATREPASPITVDLLMRTLDSDKDHRIAPSDVVEKP